MKRLFPLLLTFALVACGDDPVGTGDPFEQTFTGTVAAGDWTGHTISAPRGGTLTAVLTWPSSANDLDLLLTTGSCTGDQWPGNSCTVLDTADGVADAQEVVAATVSSGQQYKVWVDSYADVSSTYTIRVRID